MTNAYKIIAPFPLVDELSALIVQKNISRKMPSNAKILKENIVVPLARQLSGACVFIF